MDGVNVVDQVDDELTHIRCFLEAVRKIVRLGASGRRIKHFVAELMTDVVLGLRRRKLRKNVSVVALEKRSEGALGVLAHFLVGDPYPPFY